MKKIPAIVLILMMLHSAVMKAQDIHFSQFYVQSSLLNPADPATLNSPFKVSLNNKRQWMKNLEGYKTLASSFDCRLKERRNDGIIAAGLNWWYDKSGDTNFKKSGVALSLSSKIKLNKANFLSAGLQVAYNQHSVNFDEITWGSQYDGYSFDENLPSNENLSSMSSSFFDAGVGMIWQYGRPENFHTKLSASCLHVNRPNESMYSSISSPLHRKWVISGEAFQSIPNSHVTLIPKVILSRQGPSDELIIGTLLKYNTQWNIENSASVLPGISIGAMVRMQDAFIFIIGYDYFDICSVGFSYDINISDFSFGSYGRGGPELSFVLKRFKKSSISTSSF